MLVQSEAQIHGNYAWNLHNHAMSINLTVIISSRQYPSSENFHWMNCCAPLSVASKVVSLLFRLTRSINDKSGKRSASSGRSHTIRTTHIFICEWLNGVMFFCYHGSRLLNMSIVYRMHLHIIIPLSTIFVYMTTQLKPVSKQYRTRHTTEQTPHFHK